MIWGSDKKKKKKKEGASLNEKMVISGLSTPILEDS